MPGEGSAGGRVVCTELWEATAEELPDSPAVIQGDHHVSWRRFEDLAARLAAALEERGVGPGSKVGMYMYNCPEFLVTQFAALKLRAVPINVNYRFVDDELWYILDNADAAAVVYHSSLGERVNAVAGRLGKVRAWIAVDDGGVAVDFADAFDDLVTGHDPAVRRDYDPDDIYMLYTGGTTGLPKGVMYPLGGLTRFFLDSTTSLMGVDPIEDTASLRRLIRHLHEAGSLPRAVPCCPLMHGTGMWLGAFAPHLTGGAAVLATSRRFDPDEVWRLVAAHAVTSLVIVGDAFARPLLDALRSGRHPAADLQSLRSVVSSGAMFSAEVKQGLIDLLPGLSIRDVLGATEGAMGRTISGAGSGGATGAFTPNPGVVVLDDELQPVEPGSGDIGVIASTGVAVPLGYYKDPARTAATFKTIGGVRYAIHGDMATVEADGTVRLLGRGSNVINTGGEKVFVEEVEEAVKRHPLVEDCLVFGEPDERFGQRVVAVASLVEASTADQPDLRGHLDGRIASFKIPRRVTFVGEVPRHPNGKADYEAASRMAGRGA